MPAKRVLTPAGKRLADANRSAEWREAHRNVPVPRDIDRVVVEAFLIAIQNSELVRSEQALEIMKSVTKLAVIGFERRGYTPADSRPAIGKRLKAHRGDSQSSCVKAALDEKAAGLDHRRDRGLQATAS